MKKRLFILTILIVTILFGFNEKSFGETGINYLVLVNAHNKIPNDWEDKIDLETEINIYGNEINVESKTLTHYYMLKEELLKVDINIELIRGYKSYRDEIQKWDMAKRQFGIYEDGLSYIYLQKILKAFFITENIDKELVESNLQIPGYSEHNLGIAIDICLVKDGVAITDRNLMIHESEIWRKIKETLPKYGFILRYPDGKYDITGYNYEPWHIRYIDSVEIATEITENGLTLEEYLSINN